MNDETNNPFFGSPISPPVQGHNPSPPHPNSRIHSPGCPVAAAARNGCTHGTDECIICQRYAHYEANTQGWLQQLCICPTYNPSPGLGTLAGAQKMAAMVKAGAEDLYVFSRAARNVTWLARQMGEAIERIVHAQTAGGRGVSADDAWIINTVGDLLARVVPRVDVGSGAFSLDRGLLQYFPQAARQLNPDRDVVHGTYQAAAARRNLEDFSSRVVREFEAGKNKEQQQQQQQQAGPLVVNGSTSYQAPSQATALMRHQQAQASQRMAQEQRMWQCQQAYFGAQPPTNTLPRGASRVEGDKALPSTVKWHPNPPFLANQPPTNTLPRGASRVEGDKALPSTVKWGFSPQKTLREQDLYDLQQLELLLNQKRWQQQQQQQQSPHRDIRASEVQPTPTDSPDTVTDSIMDPVREDVVMVSREDAEASPLPEPMVSGE